METPQNFTTASILRAIEEGTLSCDHIVSKLQAAVEAEYNKREEANISLMNACEDLLWQIQAREKQPFVSHQQEYLVALRSKIRIKRPKRPKPKLLLAASVTAALAIAVFAFGGLTRWQWFTFKSTPDQQQYLIKGHEIDLTLIQSSIAAHDDFAEKRTESWQEVIDFLGFEPQSAFNGAKGFAVSEYYVYILPSSISVHCHLYKTENTELGLIYSIQYFTDLDNAGWAFEQNCEGKTISMNGTTVYLSENIDRASAMWVHNSTVQKLAGSIRQEELIHFLQNQLGGKNNE